MLLEKFVMKSLLLKMSGPTMRMRFPMRFFHLKIFLNIIDPNKEKFEETSGNEGATVDKQHNWAALLL